VEIKKEKGKRKKEKGKRKEESKRKRCFNYRIINPHLWTHEYIDDTGRYRLLSSCTRIVPFGN